MANFTATDTFSDVVVLETTDQVLGGLPSSPSNKQAQALVNRTEWLKKRIGNREVVVRTLGAMDNLSLSNDMGKLIIVDSDSTNSVRGFSIVIGSAGKVNGNTVTVYFRPNDTTLLIGTRGSVRYFSGDLVEFIFDGTSFVGNIIHRDLATGMPPVVGFLSGAHVGLTLPTISNNYYIPAIGAGDITRLQLQGGNYPNIGTVIRLYNISGTPRILRQLTSTVEGEFIIYSGVQYDSVTDLRYVLEEGEYADFRLSAGNLWYLIEKDISAVPLNGIVPNGSIDLPTATYPSLRNWLNKIIERVEFPEALLFKGEGIGLTVGASTDWSSRVVRFGFNKIYNNSRSIYDFTAPASGGSGIVPSALSLPNWRLSELYLNEIKEMNYFRPIANSGDYSIDFKFRVKNLGLATTLGFSLMKGNFSLSNPVGSIIEYQEAVLAAGDEVNVHLYANNFPYNALANNNLPSSPPYELYPYIWVLVEDTSGPSTRTYEFSDCQVELKSVYL